jgi:hypothetical protein
MKTNESLKALLLDILSQRFSLSELETLCFKLGISTDDFPRHARPDLARDLLTRLAHRDRLHELVAVGRTMRPDIEWPADQPTSITQHQRAKQPALLVIAALIMIAIFVLGIVALQGIGGGLVAGSTAIPSTSATCRMVVAGNRELTGNGNTRDYCIDLAVNQAIVGVGAYLLYADVPYYQCTVFLMEEPGEYKFSLSSGAWEVTTQDRSQSMLNGTAQGLYDDPSCGDRTRKYTCSISGKCIAQ